MFFMLLDINKAYCLLSVAKYLETNVSADRIRSE